MKKLILSTTFLIAGACGLLAQGEVDFDNAPWLEWGDSQDRLIYASAGVPVVNAEWKAALFEQRGANWVQLGDQITFFGAGLDGILMSDGVKRIVSVPAGTATQLKISVFDQAGALLGSSDPFGFTMGTATPPGAKDTLMLNFKAFVVPEPSTIALGVLGLGALLLFRRRK